jgi:hypothetical protein
MKIADIIAEAARGRFLYHGTSRAFLPQIALRGLQPQAGEAEEYEDEAPYPRVWATQVQDHAREYAEFYSDPVILRFRSNIAQWESDSWPPGHSEIFTRTGIPPASIQVLWTDGKWYPLTAIKGIGGGVL